MDKEKLIAAMREAVYSAPTDNAENECLIGIGWERIDRVTELCAEAALKELGNEWVRVEEYYRVLELLRAEVVSSVVDFAASREYNEPTDDELAKHWEAYCGFKSLPLPSPPKDK